MFASYFEKLHYLIMLLLHKITGGFISSDEMNVFPEGFFSSLHFTKKKNPKKQKTVAYIQEVGLSNSVTLVHLVSSQFSSYYFSKMLSLCLLTKEKS